MTQKISTAELERREELARLADSNVRLSIHHILMDTGRQAIDRPIFRDRPDGGTFKDASPADGLVIARAIELKARKRVRDYLRDAREAGMGWRKLGELLNLEHEAEALDRSVGELAFDIGAGTRDPDNPWRERSFYWRCQTCQQLVSDRGPETWPADAEDGHTRGCRRLAAETREWNRRAAE